MLDEDFAFGGLAALDPDADVPLDVDEAVAEAERAVGVNTPPEGTALRQEAADEDASCAVFGPIPMVNGQLVFRPEIASSLHSKSTHLYCSMWHCRQSHNSSRLG